MAEKYDIGLKGFPAHKQNPFLANLLVDKKRKLIATANSKDKTVVDKVTGEIDDAMFIGIRKEVDSEQFVKIFVGQINTLFELTKAGRAVFTYILGVVTFDDKIIFMLDQCQERTGYKSEAAVRAGLTELLQKEFIAKGPIPNVYYINPAIFYKGDRLVLMTEYRRKGAKKIKDKDQINLFDEFQQGKTNSDS
jgi:hypothetical protein